jgi:hypothetical protein
MRKGFGNWDLGFGKRTGFAGRMMHKVAQAFLPVRFSKQKANRQECLFHLLFLLFASCASAFAAIDGTVINQTTGKPQPGAEFSEQLKFCGECGKPMKAAQA